MSTANLAAAKAGTVRMSADERRRSVQSAALAEFSKGGLHGTSTEAIAKRVGVSQPYLFRLFPNKKALFLAAGRLAFERVGDVMAAVVHEDAGVASGICGDDAPGWTPALKRMGEAYVDLITSDPDLLMMLLQLFAASHDPEIRTAVRACWTELEGVIAEHAGVSPEIAAAFIPRGMGCTVVTALDLPIDRYMVPIPELDG